MHLIRHCSVCGNKCGRLSASVPSRHVSSPPPARLPAALLSPPLPSFSPCSLSLSRWCGVCASLPTSTHQLCCSFNAGSPFFLLHFFSQARLRLSLLPSHNPSVVARPITTLSTSFLFRLPNGLLSSSRSLLRCLSSLFSFFLSLYCLPRTSPKTPTSTNCTSPLLC